MHNAIPKFIVYQKDVLNRSNDVVKHHNYNMLQFKTFIQYRYNDSLVTPERVTLEDCMDYISVYRTAKITNWPHKGQLPKHNTIVEKAKTLRVFFARCNMMWITCKFNWESIPKLTKDHSRLDWMKSEEYQIFRQAPLFYEENKIIAMRNQLLVDVPYNTGLRRAEILRCKFEYFHSPKRQFEIIWKGWYVDAVCFTEKLQKAVFEYEKEFKKYTHDRPIENDFIFVWLDNKNRWEVLCEKFINLIYNKYSVLLMWDGKISRNITPHMWRHSFATNCVLSWVSEQATTRLMRHRDPKTTMRYYHMNDKWLMSEYEKISL